VDLASWIDAERATQPEFREAWDEAREATRIARALADLRVQCGLSQRDVAARLGTSQQAISRMENPAYRGHSLRMLTRYVEALGARLQVRIVRQVPT